MQTHPAAGCCWLAVLLPFVGDVLAGLCWADARAQRVALLTAAARAGVAAGIAADAGCSPTAPVVYLLGGWAPPLGIALRADGPSVVMLLAVAVVVCGIGVYARADFGTPPARRRRARPSSTGCCCWPCGDR
jgi:multicomponent Na+:H+ antiporter subunit D